MAKDDTFNRSVNSHRVWIATTLLFAIISTYLFFSGQASKTRSSSLVQIPSGSFATPESAIRHFVEGLASDNPSQAFEACAILEPVEGFDFKEYASQVGSLSPYSDAPPNSKFQTEFNRIKRLRDITRQARNLILSLALTDDRFRGLSDGQVVSLGSETERANLVDLYTKQDTLSVLEDVEIVRIDVPKLWKEKSSDPLAKTHQRKRGQITGEEDSTERVVLFRINDQHFSGGFRLVQFGGNWKIEMLSSNFAGTSSSGSAELTSEQQYVSEYLE